MCIKADEYKSYFWLEKTTSNKPYQPCRPALCKCSIVYHKKIFKATDRTYINAIEGQNSLIKIPYKAIKGLLKHMIPICLDQLILKGFANLVLSF